jgi:hypothetical protein
MQKVQINWPIPTTREDGTALNASDIQAFRVYVSDSGIAGPYVQIAEVAGTVTQYTTPPLASGPHYFQVKTVDTANRASETPSDPQLADVPVVVAPPSAPSGVTVVLVP